MLVIVSLISITIFSLILFRLLTTNTWTTGKKLLVGFISGFLFDLIGDLMISLNVIPIDALSILLIHAPINAVGLMMAFLMYKKLM